MTRRQCWNKMQLMLRLLAMLLHRPQKYLDHRWPTKGITTTTLLADKEIYDSWRGIRHHNGAFMQQNCTGVQKSVLSKACTSLHKRLRQHAAVSARRGMLT